MKKVLYSIIWLLKPTYATVETAETISTVETVVTVVNVVTVVTVVAEVTVRANVKKKNMYISIYFYFIFCVLKSVTKLTNSNRGIT